MTIILKSSMVGEYVANTSGNLDEAEHFSDPHNNMELLVVYLLLLLLDITWIH